jgi:hypothetical protein
MMNATMKDALQALLNSGDLESPIVYLGELIHREGAEPNVNGWNFEQASSVGAPTSHGVEALREKLLAEGRRDLAGMIPVYHVADFWRNDQYNFGFVSGANKFEFPNPQDYGLSKEQGAALIKRLVELDNLYFVHTMLGAGERLTKM